MDPEPAVPLALSVVLAPLQIGLDVKLGAADGNALTVNAELLAVTVQPLLLVTVTV